MRNVLGAACAVVLVGCSTLQADQATEQQASGTPAALLPPQGKTREIDFTTDEGTWMALDVAPNGEWLVFDLLGHLYRLPLTGGEATLLTASSNNALNFHPAISRDGKRIAFISDRSGQNNVWVMDADGGNARPVFLHRETRFMQPAWAPDGRSIVAVRAFPTPGRGWHRQTNELWRLSLEGRPPARLLGERLMHYEAPTFSPDGKHLYFHVSYSTGDGLGLLTAGHRIQRLDLTTGKVENVRTNEPTALSAEFVAALRRTAYAADNAIDPPAALTPSVAPDGKSIAFALEQPGKAMTYRRHEYAPRTAIVIRDLATGAERTVLDPAAKDLTMVNAQYSYGVFPRFAWTPDGKSLVAWEGGKLRRIDVATGNVATIPFTARVHRILSETARSRITIDDSSFAVKFIQWPVASHDGRRLAFVAVGKVWLMELPNGRPQELTSDMNPAVQLTPAWSPDGRQIAFATWDDSARGAVWTVSAAPGGAPRKVSTFATEYFFPTWAPNGDAIVVSRGPLGNRPGAAANRWNTANGWTAVRLRLSGDTTPDEIADLTGVQTRRTYFGPGGRLYYQHQDRATAARGLLYYPFPADSALSLVLHVRSVPPNGGTPRDHVTFPASFASGSEPVLSPGGAWTAYQAGRVIYIVTTPAAGATVNTDPNDDAPGRVRVFNGGGIHHSWRDSTTLQFASGNRYITYNAATRRLDSIKIDLRIPRPRPYGRIALLNAKIITIDSVGVIERGTIIVNGARIACVGTAAQCDTSGVDRVIDATGKTIIPGLLDLHAHHTFDAGGVVLPHRPTSALDLAYGVTTILDPSAASESAFPLGEMIEAGVIVGPRTYSVGELVIHPGTGFGDQKIIRNQADADREVDRRVDWGAVSIKNFRQSARYQQQLIMQAARRRKVTVTGEGGPLYFDVGVILDGQTGWEHLLANLPVYKDAATFFGKAGAVYSPTAIVAGHVHGSMQWFRQLQDLRADAKYRRFMPTVLLERTLADLQPLPKSAFSFPIIAEGLADIVRAGGHGALGEHGEQPGIGTHWELWAYAEALTPLEALKVATIDGAYFIGLERETGSLTKGKLADLVVLNADPLRDIRNSADIAYVMKAGRLYDDETLDEVWPTRRSYGPIPWK
ncbi:MAG TPA: amidohydrolase family protein [Gemmatimonadaceae bacterium]|nr:amidohydrolase family protein [Gemmatimonadaceae bacterium]